MKRLDHTITILPRFQHECEARMRREIYYCVSELVSELGGVEEFWEDLSPIFSRYDHETPALEHGWRIDKSELTAIEYCEENCLDPYIVEALEHWLVSDWLSKQLRDRDEMVLEDFLGLTIWGRTTSGQSLYIDGVIEQIFWKVCLTDSERQAFAEEAAKRQEVRA